MGVWGATTAYAIYPFIFLYSVCSFRGFSLIICTFWATLVFPYHRHYRCSLPPSLPFFVSQCCYCDTDIYMYVFSFSNFFSHSVLETLIFKWTFILYNSSVEKWVERHFVFAFAFAFVCVLAFLFRLFRFTSRLVARSLARFVLSSFTAVEPQAQQYGPNVHVISHKTEIHFNGGTTNERKKEQEILQQQSVVTTTTRSLASFAHAHNYLWCNVSSFIWIKIKSIWLRQHIRLETGYTGLLIMMMITKCVREPLQTHYAHTRPTE